MSTWSCLRQDGYIAICGLGGSRDRLQHRLVVEEALGRPLRGTEQVHHFDGNKANNDPSNLVVCPDTTYHKLLERRQKALEACGNPDWLKRHMCKEYDTPLQLQARNCGGRGQTFKAFYHRQCDADRARAWRAKKRAA